MKNYLAACLHSAAKFFILHSSFFIKLSFISIPIPLRNMNQDQSYNKEFLQICRHSTLFPIIRSLTGVYMSAGRVYVSVGKGVVDTLFFDNHTRNAY